MLTESIERVAGDLRMSFWRATLLFVCLLSASCQRAPQAHVAQMPPTISESEIQVEELPGISPESSEREGVLNPAWAIQIESPAKLLGRIEDEELDEPLHAPRRFIFRDNSARYLNNHPQVVGTFRISPDEEDEARYARQLQSQDPDVHLYAAWRLWQERSRKHAAAVIEFAEQLQPQNEAEREFQQTVVRESSTSIILQGLQTNQQYRTSEWAVWLAQLKPHPDFVPALIDRLSLQLPQQSGAMLALGKSRDPRALRPLVAILLSDTYHSPALAALALGDLGLPEAEPYLLEVLDRKTHWGVKVGSCESLGKIGSARSLPALEKLTATQDAPGETGMIGKAAAAAMMQIRERGKRG